MAQELAPLRQPSPEKSIQGKAGVAPEGEKDSQETNQTVKQDVLGDGRVLDSFG